MIDEICAHEYKYIGNKEKIHALKKLILSEKKTLFILKKIITETDDKIICENNIKKIKL